MFRMAAGFYEGCADKAYARAMTSRAGTDSSNVGGAVTSTFAPVRWFRSVRQFQIGRSPLIVRNKKAPGLRRGLLLYSRVQLTG
jgi:hypothetical protein